MKHLRKLNRIYLMIVYLPRGNLCLKDGFIKVNKSDESPKDNEPEDHGSSWANSLSNSIGVKLNVGSKRIDSPEWYTHGTWIWKRFVSSR